jgi:hypothetical protein
MATAQMDTVIRHLRGAVLRQDEAGRTDGQLLASFIDQKDEAAFEALVRLHGPMVFGVCRRVIGTHHDAEDAAAVLGVDPNTCSQRFGRAIVRLRRLLVRDLPGDSHT